jgi:hypothetical protein
MGNTKRRVTVQMLVLAILATGCGRDTTSSLPPSPASTDPSLGTVAPARNPAAVVEGQPYEPAIDPADFVPAVDNPYFPLEPGTTLVYEGESDGEHERVEVTTTDDTREILGITATVVHDQVFVDGQLAEDTFDWFAQDRWGNVWYLGEDTKEYDGGEVVSTEGSWEAGVDGALPGIVMLGDPRVRDAYRQEFYEGEAEDMAGVIAVDESVTVPYGTFDRVLVTEDSTPLEPKLLEHKLYAEGIGAVMEELVRGGSDILELVDVRTDGAAG